MGRARSPIADPTHCHTPDIATTATPQHPLALAATPTAAAAAAMGKQQQGGGGGSGGSGGLGSLASLKLTRKKLKPTRVNEHMILVPGVLSVGEAQRFIDAAEAAGFEHQSSRGPAYGEAIRDNHRISWHDPALAEQLWSATGISRVMGDTQVDGMPAVGLNPNIRLYRYTAGQKFGRHIDDSVELVPGRRWTGYTLLVYLSGQQQQQQLEGGGGGACPSVSSRAPACSKAGGGDAAGGRARGARRGGAGGTAAAAPLPAQIDTSSVQQLVGGETVFYDERGRVAACVAPAPGLALLHLHGEDRCLEHEGAAVVRGVKYVLRSDVVFEAPS